MSRKAFHLPADLFNNERVCCCCAISLTTAEFMLCDRCFRSPTLLSKQLFLSQCADLDEPVNGH